MTPAEANERYFKNLIEEWYSSAYDRGVRLNYFDRERLAKFVAQRSFARRQAEAVSRDD